MKKESEEEIVLPCGDCGKETAITDYYMVNFELWGKYGNGKDLLCINCLSKRVGRPLTKKDLLEGAPVNDPWFSLKTDELIPRSHEEEMKRMAKIVKDHGSMGLLMKGM